MTHCLNILRTLCYAVCLVLAAAGACAGETRRLKTLAPGSESYTHGLFWQISRADHKPSFLYGTIHLDTPSLRHLPPRANLAFAQATTLITEVDLDPSSHAAYAQASRLPARKTLVRLLGSHDFERLAVIARHYGIESQQVNQFKPWAVTNLIARPPARSGIVLDEVLQQRAVELNKPVVALESMTELVQRLDLMPFADQLALLRDAIRQHLAISAEAEALLTAYVDEDLGRIAASAAGPHANEALARRFQKAMLWDRSRLMVERLQAHLQRGNVFIAVGALHLPGERGILRQLVQQGYTVTAVAP
jgi:uncharacterized protein